MTESSYLLAGQATERERLQLQSRVWEPAGQRLLEEIGGGRGRRVLEVGCGAMGWLRLLSRWVGTEGQVVGTDIDETMLSAADRFVADKGLGNVALLEDDIFQTDLEPGSFDLVHARFQLSLGRWADQIATYVRLLRTGGIVVLEDVDPGSWHCVPPAPAHDQLIPLIAAAFGKVGIEIPSTTQLEMFRSVGIGVNVRAEVVALPPGHPYQRLALQFASALQAPMQSIAGAEELERLVSEAERELEHPDRWGLTTRPRSPGRRDGSLSQLAGVLPACERDGTTRLVAVLARQIAKPALTRTPISWQRGSAGRAKPLRVSSRARCEQ
ncbi:hypothetical protein BH23ACT12_BH23ACT12_11820 [soil metagenome]